MQNPKQVIYITLVAIVIFFILSATGCKKPDDNQTSVASCEGCHTNYAHLQKVYSPDTSAPAGGCGGEAPHYEPYDRVYMGGTGYENFKKSTHYYLKCTDCHNGTDNTSDKNLAHSGNFISHPSSKAEEKCGSCHQKVVQNFKTSIHNGTGQKRKVCIRSGFGGAEDFEKLPQHQQEGYLTNCATCHGTCGNCHVVRPLSGGGGLANGHNFSGNPDMVTVCITCHSSRGGHAYLGVASGTQPDVHFKTQKFTCISCHPGSELHGDGKPVDQRYAYSRLQKCETCHPSLEKKNKYHSAHYTTFNCQVCHSQDYNNCGSCHIHGQGARIPSYLGFKIAINPLPDIKKDYKFSLVRRTLAAPDNWEKYGVSQYANFSALPTYNFATPHNILRWTKRTIVENGQACYTNCHIRKEGTEIKNKELYLFESDLLDWEKSATTPITVDNKLPASWPK